MPSFTAVTPEEVKQILDTGDLTNDQILAFTTSADALIEEEFVNAVISDTLVHKLTIWVSAHFIAATAVQQLESAEAGGAKASFQGSTGRLFQSTFYGQMALSLDPTGILSNLDRTNRRPVQFCALATSIDEY